MKVFQIIILLSILLLFSVEDNAFAKNTNVQQAKNFSLKDTAGNNFTLSELRGEIVVLNFWATWCVPCLREMPELEKLYQNYKDKGVKVVGIAVVSNKKDIPRQTEKVGVTYPVLLGDKKIISDYNQFYSIPQTFIIDRDGNIVKQLSGSHDYAVFEKELQKVLN